MQTRRNKDALHEFTTINTTQGTYELWNSLTTEQENLVLEQLSLEKGGLPISKKDIQRHRLLFGQGAFGKVRLARKEGKFLAVKKLAVKSDEEQTALLKEYDFGHILKAANIPHVAYSTDGVISEGAQGQKRLYLFMDSVAALGDGTNFKKLISYLPSDPKRDAILKHAARSILEAATKMQEHQIYHRDIKASNLLVSATGEIFLSDFGSAATSNVDLINDVLNQNSNYYAVSMISDKRYFTPELNIAIALNKPLPATTKSIDALHDNWRLGLTLLQLCGVLKEGKGLLRLPHNSTDNFGNVSPGWLVELKQVRSDKPLAKRIIEYYQAEIEKIKAEALHKIPTDLQPIILGLLEIDPEKRFAAADALNLLPLAYESEKQDVADGFKIIVHNQIAESVKNKIKKALKEEAKGSSDGNQWIDKALKDFQNLVKEPYTAPQNIQNFINYWILDEKNRPNLTLEHYDTMLERVKKKINRRQEQVAYVPLSDTLPEVREPLSNSQVTYQHQDTYDGLEPVLRDINDNHYLPLTPLITGKDTPHHSMNQEEANHYLSLSSLITKNDSLRQSNNQEDMIKTNDRLGEVVTSNPSDHYSPLQISTSEVTDLSCKSKQPPDDDTGPAFLEYSTEDSQENHPEDVLQSSTEDAELSRLGNAFIKAAEELMSYYQSKVTRHTLNNEMKKIIDSIKKGFKCIKEMLPSKSDDITSIEQSIGSPIDKVALKAVLTRMEQITSQLSFGKILQFDEQGVISVVQMLTKDKQFLESIANKTNKRDKIDEMLHKINEKLNFLDQSRQKERFLISSSQLNVLTSLENEPEATTFVANNDETDTHFTFTKAKNITSYELPIKFTNDVRNFIASHTINELNKVQKIFIYASRGEIGKAIAQTILQESNNNKHLKIYVNDQLISLKNQQSRGKLFGFFGEKVKPTLVKQHEKFTVKEIGGQESSLR